MCVAPAATAYFAIFNATRQVTLCDYFDLGSRSRSSICHNGENDGLFDAIQFDREPLREAAC